MARTPAPPPTAAEEDWGPTVRGGRRRRGRRLAVVLVVVLGLLLLYGTALAARLSSSIQRTEVTALDGSGGPMHTLVIGSDSREGLTEEEMLELGTGSVEGERTDSIFVLSVQGGKAGILAFPRDLYVERCDGSRGRINAALAIGGVDCLVDTVEAVSGLGIDHYMAVSFGGFRDIVDAVGGVDVCLDRAMEDPFAGINLDAGCQTLDGKQALGFVRTRKLDNDLERIKRQQQFLGALARKIATPATLLDPTTSWPLTGAVGDALTADGGLGLLDLGRLGLGARGMAQGAAVTATVPATGATIGGASVLEIDDAQAQPLFASWRDGSALGAASADVTPADTRVRVLNGAGVTGLAASTRDALTQRGYEVVGIGDAEQSLETTVIRHPAGQQANAELLQRDLPVSATLEESGSVDVVTLVLGTDLAEGL
jgi:LCP family protein required for cell wall assembly